MLKTIKKFSFIGWVFFFFTSMTEASPAIKLATTTSTYHSGLLDYLLPVFKKETGYDVIVHPTGTGKALKMGENGDVDLVMTHAPNAEAIFVKNGFGILPRSIMYNDFILIGPKNDPANIAHVKKVTTALEKIATSNTAFISRGDDSGTHKKERALWKSTNIKNDFTNYKSIGQGMGPALTMANEFQGYTLSDRGTWLAYKNKLELTLLFEGDPKLINPYQVILVNPAHYPDTNSAGAKTLSDWLVSKKTQSLINQFRVNGETLFIANASESMGKHKE